MTHAPLSRRAVLIGAGGVALAPATVPAAVRAPSLPLVVVGDWGRYGSDDQKAVATAMGRTAAAIRSRFVISLGDNFYEDGVQSVTDRHWQESFEQVYTAPSLQTMLADGTVVEFFYIDTSPMISSYRGTQVRVDDQNVPAQLAWLDAALGRSKAGVKIAVGHHPIHTVSGHGRDKKDLVQALKPILLRHGVHLYVNGHDHNLQSIARDGITFVTCGGGGAVLGDVGEAKPGQFGAKAYGYMSMEVSAGRIGYRLFDENGKALYAGQVVT